MANNQSSHVTKGIRKVLELPIMYQTLMTVLGANKLYNYFIQEILKPKAGDSILDIGCGTGKLLEYMPEDIEYTGYDLNDEYIKQAKNKYGNRAKFYCKAVDESISHEGSQKYDKVIAFALLHHLPDQVIHNLAKSVQPILKPGGVFITLDPTYVEGQSSIAKFIISKDRGQNVKFPQGYQNLMLKVFKNVEVKVLHNQINIPYNHTVLISSNG